MNNPRNAVFTAFRCIAYLLALAIVVFLTACSSSYKERDLAFDTTVYLDQLPLQVVVFTTREEQNVGLMRVSHLAEDTGGLFVFTPPADVKFWMKNVLIELDLLFFDQHGALIASVEAAKPCGLFSCPQFTAQDVKYVLEVNGGFIKAQRLTNSVRLRLL